MPKEKVTLAFGLAREVPASAACAWGARLIFPDDLLWDRQGHWNMHESDGNGGQKRTAAGQKLVDWLNGKREDGAIAKALEQARKMAKRGTISPASTETVVLYEDAKGKIVGCPNASYGYLYIAGWLKPEEKQHGS